MGDKMNIEKKVLDQLLEYANKSYKEKEIPVSAAILESSTNKLIAIAGNNRQGHYNVLGHAEINCILEAETKIKDWRLDGYYMVVTLEPCDMCSMVIKESRLDKVYYFLHRKNESNENINIEKEELLTGENYKEKFNELLSKFFDNMR